MKQFILITILVFSGISAVFAEIPIYCPECKEHLYDYQKDEIIPDTIIYAKDFLPAHDNVLQPVESDKMICPLCKAPLNWYEYQAWEKDQPIPIFYCWAITLLTKDKEGNFYWTPYDI